MNKKRLIPLISILLVFILSAYFSFIIEKKKRLRKKYWRMLS